MAPLPIINTNATGALSRLLSAISSVFKYMSSSRPLFHTQEGADGIAIMDSEVPSIPITPLAPSQLPVPTGFELKPPGPEKEPWLGNIDLQGTDEYAELISNPWDDKLKRSSTFSPSLAEVLIMLTYYTVQDQELRVITLDRAGEGAPAQQQLKGEHSLVYSPELSLFIFILLIIVSMGAAIAWAVAKNKKKLRRPIDCCFPVKEVEEDEKQEFSGCC